MAQKTILDWDCWNWGFSHSNFWYKMLSPHLVNVITFLSYYHSLYLLFLIFTTILLINSLKKSFEHSDSHDCNVTKFLTIWTITLSKNHQRFLWMPFVQKLDYNIYPTLFQKNRVIRGTEIAMKIMKCFVKSGRKIISDNTFICLV